MVRPDKIETVKATSDKLKSAQSVVLADFAGITVAQATELRTKLRAESAQMKVVKNRLVKRALADAGCDNLDDMLCGNTALAFGLEDPVAVARVMTEFAQKNAKLVIKGGLLEGRRLDVQGVKSLALMPGRKELLAMMAGGMKQPAAKLATVLQAGLLKVAHAMAALARKQEEAGGAA